MPKLKTHKGMAKRFKVTGSGKVVRKKAGGRHLLECKSGNKKRKLRESVTMPRAAAKKIKNLISPGS